jgi:predicted membrane chloride channel (bestrophin family)
LIIKRKRPFQTNAISTIRYNEGRKLFSQIIIGSRTLGRIIWYHCPDYLSPPDPENPMGEEQKKREKEVTLREKRQAVELCLAFAVSVKHCEFKAGPLRCASSRSWGVDAIT